MEKQLLHLVLGGRVKNPQSHEFQDPHNVDLVGVYPTYQEALKVWRGRAQATVDDAHMRYFVVHLHRLLDPDEENART